MLVELNGTFYDTFLYKYVCIWLLSGLIILLFIICCWFAGDLTAIVGTTAAVIVTV